jgi:hypothetical protein
VGEYAEIKTPNHYVVIDNKNYQLMPSATVQLSARNRPINLRLADENLLYTNADIVAYNPNYIVNEFSSENSLLRLAAKRSASVMLSNDAMLKGEFESNPSLKSLQNRDRALAIGNFEDTLQYDQLNISKRSDEDENNDKGVSIAPAL